MLARLGQRLEATLTPDAVLPTIVETVAQALKLPQVTIRGISQDNTTPISLAVYGTADEQEARERIPLIYQQETVGELVLVPRKSGKSLTFCTASARATASTTSFAPAASAALTTS